MTNNNNNNNNRRRHGYRARCETCSLTDVVGGETRTKQFAKQIQEYEKKHRNHDYKLEQSYHAAELGHKSTAKAGISSRQTVTSATYTDVTNADLSTIGFVANKQYLITVTAQFDTNNAGNSTKIRVVHGTTPTAFADSEMFAELNTVAPAVGHYVWWTVWQQPGTVETIKVQFAGDSAGGTYGIDMVTVTAIKLDDDLTQNTDWFYNEQIADTTLATTDSTTNNATTGSFTPASASNWLVATKSRVTGTSTVGYAASRMVSTGTVSATSPFCQQEGEATANDSYTFSLFRVFALTAVSNSFTEKGYRSGTGTGTRKSSGVFALNLNKLRNHQYSYDDTSINDLGTTSFGNQIRTVSITPDVQGDVWCMAAATFVTDTLATDFRMRIQVDNADLPVQQTNKNYLSHDMWDTTDEYPFALQAMATSMTAASHTIDFDMDSDSATGTAGPRAKLLFAVTMELPASGAALVQVEDETESITENVTVVLGLPPVVKNETEAITENVAIRMKHVEAKNETEAITEAVNIRMARREIKNETVSIPENVVVKVTMAPRLVNETEAITENVVLRLGRSTVVSETVSVGENVVVKVNNIRPPVNETESITEQIVVKVTMAPRIVNETEQITENVVYRMNMARTISETESILENVVAVVALPAKVVNEVEEITENVLVKLGLSRVIDETVAIQENVVVRINRINPPINETVSIGENVVIKINRIEPPINETVSIPEQVIVHMENVRPPVDETVAITENVIARLGISRPPIDETVGILENVVTVLGISAPPINEPVTITENVVVKLQLGNQIVNETVSISEATLIRMDRTEPPINEVISIPEDVIVRMNRVELVGEQLSISENIIVKLTNVLTEEVNEAVSISENVVIKVTEQEVFPAPITGGGIPKTPKIRQIRQKRRIWPQMSLKTYDPVKYVKQDRRYRPPTLQQQLQGPRTKVRRAFVGVYDILPLSQLQVEMQLQEQRLESLQQTLQEIPTHLPLDILPVEKAPPKSKPRLVSRTFVAKYDIYSKIKKSFTMQYEKSTLVSKTFIASYDIKVFDWATLQKLQKARTMLTAMIATEQLEDIDSLDE